MSINNAMKFVRKVDADNEFRRICNKCGSREAIQEMLLKEKMDFNDFEFEEAINMMLFKCQTYEDADGVKQIELWYNLVCR